MRKFFGRVLQVLGVGFAAWVGLVGGGFSVIYLVGFIGTSGREGGGEFLVVFTATVLGVIAGLLVARVGSVLVGRKAKPG